VLVGAIYKIIHACVCVLKPCLMLVFVSGNAVTATVTVTVKDSNDHAPVFTNEPYVTTKGELTPVQTTLISVYATDIDQGVNKAVREFICDRGKALCSWCEGVESWLRISLVSF